MHQTYHIFLYYCNSLSDVPYNSNFASSSSILWPKWSFKYVNLQMTPHMESFSDFPFPLVESLNLLECVVKAWVDCLSHLMIPLYNILLTKYMYFHISKVTVFLSFNHVCCLCGPNFSKSLLFLSILANQLLVVV